MSILLAPLLKCKSERKYIRNKCTLDFSGIHITQHKKKNSDTSEYYYSMYQVYFQHSTSLLQKLIASPEINILLNEWKLKHSLFLYTTQFFKNVKKKKKNVKRTILINLLSLKNISQVPRSFKTLDHYRNTISVPNSLLNGRWSNFKSKLFVYLEY